MSSNKLLTILSSYFFITISITLCGCATKPEEPKVEAPIPIQATQQKTGASISQTANPQAMAAEAKPREMLKLPPPKPSEVQDAVTRVYQKALQVDAGRRPNYIIGDFNGDGSQDIAVVAKPIAGKLEVLNNELANWTLEDVKNVTASAEGPTHRSALAPVPVGLEESVLVVIHGQGPEGWRSPDAQQSFLLKSAVGNNMRMRPLNSMLEALRKNERVPAVRGDVMTETISGQPGILFWNGAKYSWFRQPPADELTADRRTK